VPDFELEQRFLEQGYRFIAGVDEVGRGALCGPVVAVALVLPSSLVHDPLPAWLRQTNDSKLLTPRKRRELVRFILAAAESVGLGLCSNIEVDQKNIYWASLEAMRRAVEQMPLRPDVLLVDGFELKDVPYVQAGVRQGDKKSYSEYGLGKHKGYGTEEHYRALQKFGQTSFHRQSFRLKS
jgi:ribonuclease HII